MRWQSHTLLHLGDQLLVEQSSCLLVQRAIDGDNVALSKHLLEIRDPSAANLLLLLCRKRLVVKVQQLLAVECLQPSEHTLTDAADSDGTNDLVLEVVLVLRHLCDVPLASLDLLMGGNKVADQSKDGHDDMLRDRDDVAARDFSDGDTAIGLVGRIEIDVVGSDTSSDCNLEILGLGKTFCGQVARVEALKRTNLLVVAQLKLK